MTQPSIRIRLLGGVGRFGANAMLVEDTLAEEAIVIDCGVRLLADEPWGFDVGLPDLGVLRAYPGKLSAYVITHAHEDHVGALPHALALRSAPILATPFSARMIERRFSKARASLPVVREVHAGTRYALGAFDLEWVHVSHSIPGAAAIALRTRLGIFVHSGDFRVDTDPLVGAPTDLPRLGELGDEGVYALLADSTGADTPGRNLGERSVVEPLRRAMEPAGGRVLVTTFSSHVPRLKALEELAEATGRRLCILGEGMRSVVEIAQRQGLLSERIITDEGQLTGVVRERQLIAVTGSQGEPGSALWRLAHRKHSQLTLDAGDLVVFSARIIPGAERAHYAVSDALRVQGVRVVDGSEGRHVSGHGHREDMELLLAATRPRFFVALHGGERQLMAHRKLADDVGVARERILPAESGDALEFYDNGGARIAPQPPREWIARGLHVIEEPEPLLAARRRMATGGTLMIWPSPSGHRLVGRALDPALDAQVLAALEREIEQYGLQGTELVQRVATRIARMQARVPEVVLLDPQER